MPISDFGGLQKALETKKIEVKSVGLHRFPLTTVEVMSQQEADIEKLVSMLEEDDDVQHVM